MYGLVQRREQSPAIARLSASCVQEPSERGHDERSRKPMATGICENTLNGVFSNAEVIKIVASDNRGRSVITVDFVTVRLQILGRKIRQLDLAGALEVIRIDEWTVIDAQPARRHQQADELRNNPRDLLTHRRQFNR